MHKATDYLAQSYLGQIWINCMHQIKGKPSTFVQTDLPIQSCMALTFWVICALRNGIDLSITTSHNKFTRINEPDISQVHVSFKSFHGFENTLYSSMRFFCKHSVKSFFFLFFFFSPILYLFIFSQSYNGLQILMSNTYSQADGSMFTT